jgi:hypothetical protein
MCRTKIYPFLLRSMFQNRSQKLSGSETLGLSCGPQKLNTRAGKKPMLRAVSSEPLLGRAPGADVQHTLPEPASP